MMGSALQKLVTHDCPECCKAVTVAELAHKHKQAPTKYSHTYLLHLNSVASTLVNGARTRRLMPLCMQIVGFYFCLFTNVKEK